MVSDEEDGLEKSWAEIAMETEDEGSDGKKPVKKGDINMQDVIVASAGDDGEVWIWRPLQVCYKLNLYSIYIYCSLNTKYWSSIVRFLRVSPNRIINYCLIVIIL